MSQPHQHVCQHRVGLGHPVSFRAQGGGLDTLQTRLTLTWLLAAGGLESVVCPPPHTSPPCVSPLHLSL